MTTKSKGDSVRQRLVTLSKKLATPYRNIETAFLIERLVVRLVVVADYKSVDPDDPKLMPRFDKYYRKLKGAEK